MTALTPPMFSIVIPTYNRAEEVMAALGSVLGQTFTDWELIIVDDGSTDETLQKLETIGDQRIRVFSIEHSERSTARNVGIRQCTGSYICFLDSDDLFLANHLEILAQAIRARPGLKVFRTGAWLSMPGSHAVKCLMEKTDDSEPFPFECIQTFAFERNTIQKFKFDTRYIGVEDLYFLLQVGLQFEIYSVSAWTVVYHNRAPETNKQKLADYYKQKISCIDDILQWNQSLILTYLQRHRSLASLQLMKLCRTNPPCLRSSLFLSFQSLVRYPRPFFSVLMQLFGRFNARAM